MSCETKKSAVRALCVVLAASFLIVPDAVFSASAPAVGRQSVVRKGSIRKKPGEKPGANKTVNAASVKKSAAGAGNALYDARLRSWSKMFAAGDRKALISAIEADLAGDAPHPFAPFVWTRAHWSSGTLSAAMRGLDKKRLDRKKLFAALGALPDIFQLYAAGEYARLLDKYDNRGDSRDAGMGAGISDPWALHYLSSAAMMEHRFDAAFSYAVAAVKANPEFFQAAWLARDAAASDERVRARSLKVFGPGGELALTQAGLFLNALAVRPADARDDLASVRGWLAAHPADSSALSFKGLAELALQRPREAVESFSAAHDAFSFAVADWRVSGSPHLRALVRSGDFDAAKNLASVLAFAETAGQDKAELDSACRLASILTSEGERGLARRVLDQAIKKHPSSAELFHEYAVLERESSRMEEALSRAFRAVELAPDNAHYAMTLAEAQLSAKAGNEAYERFNRLRLEGRITTHSLYIRGMRLLYSLGRHKEAGELVSLALTAYPGSSTLKTEVGAIFIATGRFDDAAGLLSEALSVAGPAKRRLKLMAELAERAGAFSKARGAARSELASVHERFAWSTDAWEAHAEFSGIKPDDRPARFELWKAAAKANPGRVWPLAKINSVLVDSGKVDDARKIAEDSLAISEFASDRSEALKSISSALIIKLSESKSPGAEPDAATLVAASKTVDAYCKLDGFAEECFRLRRRAYLAQGSREQAASVAVELAGVLPDDWDAVGEVVRSGESGAKAWTILNRYVERDPYDGVRVANAVEMHVKWGGSPLLALTLVNDYRARGVTVDFVDPNTEAMAWARLGDYRALYALVYSRASRIGPSLRYVEWFDEARIKAFSGSASVRPDYKTGVFRITSPEGWVYLRKDHRISGKPELLSSGAAFLKAGYDASGEHLTSISASSGTEIGFEYDPAKRVRRVRSNIGPDLGFYYDGTEARPARITAEGLGEIALGYSRGGAVEASSRRGPEVAKAVLDAFGEIAGLLSRFETGSTGVLDMPYADARLDVLRREYAAKKGKTDAKAFMRWIHSALELAGYLYKHSSESPRNAAAAVAVTEEAWRGVAKRLADMRAIDAAHADVAADLAELWLRMKHDLKAGVLTRDEWALMLDMRSVLLRVKAGKKTKKTIDDAILMMTADRFKGWADSWVEKSRAGVMALWSEFPVASPLTAVLVMKNGDVVAGLQSGAIAVFGKAGSAYYTIDPEGRRFVKTSASGKGPVVNALAESPDGRLVAATSVGIFMQKAGYDSGCDVIAEGEAITGVSATTGGRIVFASPSGLERYYAGERLVYLPLSGKKVLFVRGAASDVVLAATNDGLHGVTADNRVVRLVSRPPTDALWNESEKTLVAAYNEGLFSTTWDGAGAAQGKMTKLAMQEEAARLGAAGALSTITSYPAGGAVAAFTAQGAYAYKDGRFELIRTRGRGRVIGASSSGARTCAAFEGAIECIDLHGIGGDFAGPAYDLLSLPKAGLTLSARGDSVSAIRHSDPTKAPARFMRARATRLALMKDGRVVANDGARVIAFDPTVSAPVGTELFSVRGTLSALLGASDGSVWAAAGEFLYRWKLGHVTQMSYALDPTGFPARSDSIANVFETIGGRIRVVASNEGHRDDPVSPGSKLEGGLLEWTGKGFKRLAGRDDATGAWFVTGYTSVGSGAIAASAAGFAIEKGGAYAPVLSMKNPSYDALVARMPMLWLGTAGARLADETILFGSAGGLVTYKDGVWGYPENINSMLPDDYLREVGSRAVHSVAVDPAGVIYVGTDRGVFAYDPSGRPLK